MTPTPARRREVPGLVVGIAVLLALVPRVFEQVDSRPQPSYGFHTLLFLSDVGLTAAVVVAVGSARSLWAARRDQLAGWGAVAVLVSLVPGLLVNPTDRGVAALLRLAGLAALALLFGSLVGAGRRQAVACIAAAGVVNLAVAAVQRIRRDNAGLGSIGEKAEGVLNIGGAAPFGLMVHPYVLSAWMLVTAAIVGVEAVRRTSLVQTAIAGACVVCVGLTMTRSGFVGLGAVLVACAVAAWRDTQVHRRRLLPILFGSLVIGGVIGVAVNAGGWEGRAGDTGSADPSNERGALVRQGVGLLRSDPITGVGPGRYEMAVAERPDLMRLSAQTPRPVHTTPLLLVVEGGLVALPGVVALLLACIVQAWKGRWLGALVLVSFAPYLLLDHLAWSYPQGLVLSGLWLGALDSSTRSDAVSEPPPAPA